MMRREGDMFWAIMCLDGGAIYDNVGKFRRYAEGLMEMSRAAGGKCAV